MILTVWGCGGSGKTTFTVNLAMALANKGYMVGILASQLEYADLPQHIGQSIFEKHGTFMAIKDNNAKEHFWKCDVHQYIFTLAVPNEYSGFDGEGVSLAQAEALIEQSEANFDILLVDGHESMNNAISSKALTVSDKILLLHKPSLKAYSWYASRKMPISLFKLEEKLVHLINAPDKSFEESAYLEKIHVKSKLTLPLVTSAPLLCNLGKPIYLSNERGAKEYRIALDSVLEIIETGDKETGANEH